jgi:hypothetical protein
MNATLLLVRRRRFDAALSSYLDATVPIIRYHSLSHTQGLVQQNLIVQSVYKQPCFSRSQIFPQAPSFLIGRLHNYSIYNLRAQFNPTEYNLTPTHCRNGVTSTWVPEARQASAWSPQLECLFIQGTLRHSSRGFWGTHPEHSTYWN